MDIMLPKVKHKSLVLIPQKQKTANTALSIRRFHLNQYDY